VAAIDLPDLITMIGKELVDLSQAEAAPEEEKPKPAVPIKHSIRENEIVCLVCGKPKKMLKHHLATLHELEPQAYRAMFGLKDEHPLGGAGLCRVALGTDQEDWSWSQAEGDLTKENTAQTHGKKARQ